MQKVDAEVRRIIDEQYALARKLLEENRDKMHKMANALLEWETIDSDQIDDIMNGNDPRPPKESGSRKTASNDLDSSNKASQADSPVPPSEPATQE